jgi:amidase
MTAVSLTALPARALAALIADRRASAVEVMEAHLAAIAAWNPHVNAVVGLLPLESCLAAAVEADRAQADGVPLGALHGLPTAIKDLNEARGLVFTRGSPIYRNAIGQSDSVLVERLRGAGAIPVGKTNVPEFGLGSHTFNPVWGVTRNPFDLSKSAGGSSGGAAVAVSTGMVPFADGSDLGGSLRNPANFNNVVALRPTVGLVPTAPDAFPRLGFGVNGPIARTVDDLAFLLGVMAGPDPRDPGCEPSDPAWLGRPLTGELARPVRVAWSPDLGGLPMEPAVRTVVDAQRAVLAAAGCDVEPATLDLSGAEDVFLTVRRWRSAAVYGPLLAGHRADMKPELVEEIDRGARLTGADVARALAAHTALLTRVAAFFERFDVLACAVNQVAPFEASCRWPGEVDGIPMDHYVAWMRSTYWITTTFAPAVSVPAGFTDTGLPVGLQLVGRPRGDRQLLELAYAFEQVNPAGRVRPTAPTRA